MVRAFMTTVVACALSLAPPAVAQTLSPGSKWVNERGSTFTIDGVDTATGAVSGMYITAAENFPCRGTPFPINGYVNGDRIGFVVHWKSPKADCMAMNVFSGFIVDGKLVTEWDAIFFDVNKKQSVRFKGKDVYAPTK